ncbi:ATP-binding protein [Henriciella marina]|uniref:ATP-binding protein n=1 Tax=Henriciella marina TaxID=453851 RepID=UPI00036B59CB|nr:ATP-binding protein [Henriciella marina]
MTELKKPDMAAVLERTKIGSELDDFLIPIYECISNALHAIEDRGFSNSVKEGKIRINVSTGDDPSDFEISISDNGVGLDDVNYQHFLTPYSGHKLTRKGKGVGRFMAFKCFQDIGYQSRFLSPGVAGSRSFKFDIYRSDDEIYDEEDVTPDIDDIGCRVAYRGIKAKFAHLHSKLEGELFSSLIVSQFVSYFLENKAPSIEIDFDGTTYRGRDLYTKTFTFSQSGKISVELGGENVELDYNISRVTKGRQFKHHSLFMTAANRIVGSARNITEKVGAPHFQSADGSPYVLIAQVSGEYLDDHVDDSRTKLTISPEEIGSIVKAIGEVILQNERDEEAKIRARKARAVTSIISINPMLRIGLRGHSIAEYVSTKPNGWDEVRFVEDLSVSKHRVEKGWYKKINSFIDSHQIENKDYEAIFDNLDDIRKNSLAQYVLHRQKIIEVTDKIRGLDDVGKFKKEDVMHEIIMRRHSDTTELGVLDLNLWLIDDRLSFVSYVSSDRVTTGKGRPKGSKIADLVFYEDGLVLGEKSGSHTLIVEFKRPGRDDYAFGRKGFDPIQQVLDTAEFIRNQGEIVDLDGKSHQLRGNAPIHAFVIDDLKPSMKALLKKHDFSHTWDETGFYRYQSAYNVFIEVISYEKMIFDAKLRNATFFELLMGDLVLPETLGSEAHSEADNDESSGDLAAGRPVRA